MRVQLSRMMLATTRTEAMIRFYNEAFGCGFEPQGPLHVGTLSGIELALVPNEIAEIDARQSRLQFEFTSTALDSLVERVRGAGGTVELSTQGGIRTASVIDPDANTISVAE